jgi:type IV secretion system protein VirD4
MRRHLSTKALLGIAFLIICGTSIALAQYGRPGFDPFAPQQRGVPNEMFAVRVVMQIVAALAGFVIGAFFSPKLRGFRRFMLAVLIIGGLAFALFGPEPFADWMAGIVAFFVFFLALGLGLSLGRKALVRQEEEPPTSFGTAKWATEAYLRQRGLFEGKGFFLGEFLEEGNRNPIHYSGARHLLTVAPTRSGKGVASIVPNLLTYEGSVFVIDPKGENAMITAPRRGRGDHVRGIPGLGQSVFLVDPWNIAAADIGLRPARFNPLDWIKADDPDAAENAFLLADALVPAESAGEARFWDDEAKALLTGIILFVATSKTEGANRHLGRVRDILLLDEDDFKAVLTTMFKEPLPVVSSTAARTASKDVKLRSNVMAAVQSHTHFLDSPRIRESLSASDFRFEDLRTKPTTVYLILPADRLKTFDRWLRLLIQQAITVNARDISAKPEKPVLFLLDEMASLGRLSMVEQAYGLMAGFGMQLWGIVQDLSQLERIYGDGWQTFISNSGVIQYFGSRDKITAEYFSTLCGVTTIRIFSWSYALGRAFGSSSGPGGGGSNESTSHTHTTSTNESQRQLAYPDELMVLKEDAEIVFVENYDPIHGKKLRWYQNAELRALGVNLHPELEQRVIEQPPAQLAAPKQAAASAPRKKRFQEAAQPVGEKANATVASNTTPKPASPAAPETVEPHVVDRQEYGDTVYTMYSDGSIGMTTPSFSHRFASRDELTAYLDSLRAPAQE